MAPNRLGAETSPYLLQHAHNPVDWYPWGEEALQRSRREDKPILLSIGYSACHWCHVMERESFEDEETAALMNESFVCIKVDREERPDIDEIYMSAVQMMTGSGGWPLTVFLTPALEPFYGGTYFPPENRFNLPSFKTVLEQIARVYRDERPRVVESATRLTERLQGLAATPETREILSRRLIGDAARDLASRFDPRHGGFSPAPKFPPAGSLSLLMRHHVASPDRDTLFMVTLTLDKMAAGGMYDHLGGGFHRYATDSRWLVPHFEKMLYDNALLARAYLEAYQLTGNEDYAHVARECLDWILREMQGAEGGYYSSQDADSEGVEGKFYVWSYEEVHRLLGADAASFCDAYDVTPGGNWEASNILNRTGQLDEEHDPSRRTLFEARERRVRPNRDDKVLTSWNALTIIAMARGYRVLGDERFLSSARRAGSFILERLFEGDRLLASYRLGRGKHKAYLDDYAFLLGGFVELFECDFDGRWLASANRLASELKRLFHDEALGGFFFTGSDHEKLITRSKTAYDGAIPSGNALAASYLLKLSEYTGSREHEALGARTLRAFHALMERSPSAFAHMLLALDFHLSPKREIVVVGREADSALRDLWRIYAPNVAIVHVDPQSAELHLPVTEGKSAGPDPRRPRFYVCSAYRCQAPTDSLDEVISSLRVLE
ncbi:MAG TPA: thioredoxin domain-containing protein [Vicinamibacteria bacterium]|nr:thioredoxin domain-containing protein [Vicinamibacteria bacterium]